MLGLRGPGSNKRFSSVVRRVGDDVVSLALCTDEVDAAFAVSAIIEIGTDDRLTDGLQDAGMGDLRPN